jgi:hypothetical protein
MTRSALPGEGPSSKANTPNIDESWNLLTGIVGIEGTAPQGVTALTVRRTGCALGVEATATAPETACWSASRLPDITNFTPPALVLFLRIAAGTQLLAAFRLLLFLVFLLRLGGVEARKTK